MARRTGRELPLRLRGLPTSLHGFPRAMRDSMVARVQTRVRLPGACREEGRIGEVIVPWTQRQGGHSMA